MSQNFTLRLLDLSLNLVMSMSIGCPNIYIYVYKCPNTLS